MSTDVVPDINDIQEAWEKKRGTRLFHMYNRLASLLGVSPKFFIWCFTKYEYWGQHEVKRLWELNVPVDDIRWVNKEEWNKFRLPESDKYRELEEFENVIVLPDHSQGNNSYKDLTAILIAPVKNDVVVNNSRFSIGNYSILRSKKNGLPNNYDDVPIFFKFYEVGC